MIEIIGVVPKENYCIEVKLNNKHTVLLDLTQKVKTARFSCLKDLEVFRSVSLKEGIVNWDNKVELSSTEILQLVQQNK